MHFSGKRMCLLATSGQDGVASLGDYVAPGSTEVNLVSAAGLQGNLTASSSIFAACPKDV